MSLSVFRVAGLLLLACAAIAEVHNVTAERYYHSFDHRHPVLSRVKSGDTVITRTLDAGGQDQKGVRVSTPSNPLTGPFFIEGAEPGDALAIRFSRIRMNRNWGWSNYRLGLFSLAPESIESLYPRRYKDDLIRPGRSDLVPWDLDLQRGTVRLREPVSKVHPMEFPARPMLGCVGVAAVGDFAPNSGISGTYGGNMDYNEIVEGVTVTLPVYHPGGLLFIGDGHACRPTASRLAPESRRRWMSRSPLHYGRRRTFPGRGWRTTSILSRSGRSRSLCRRWIGRCE